MSIRVVKADTRRINTVANRTENYPNIDINILTVYHFTIAIYMFMSPALDMKKSAPCRFSLIVLSPRLMTIERDENRKRKEKKKY